MSSPDLPPAPPAAADAAAATVPLAPPGLPPAADTTSVGWLEVALPLWHRKWRIVVSGVVGALMATGLLMLQPVRYSAQSSFIVQSMLRPNAQGAGLAGSLPALAGLMSSGSPTDLHVSILRSHSVTDRIVERFQLQRSWALKTLTETRARLSQRVAVNVGKRDGTVTLVVEDEHPQRAAAIANELVSELRRRLREFALEESRLRRQFFEAQLSQARAQLADSQRRLQVSGVDKATLRTDAKAAAEAYGRLEGEIAAAELRLGAARRVRAEGSAEVQTLLAELQALKSRLASLEKPQVPEGGEYLLRAREFRYAETLADTLSRQLESARLDEAADATTLQVLDQARPPEFPSKPVFARWPAGGLLAGVLLQGAWVLLRHRQALARLQPGYEQRLALLRSVLVPARRHT